MYLFMGRTTQILLVPLCNVITQVTFEKQLMHDLSLNGVSYVSWGITCFLEDNVGCGFFRGLLC